MRRRCPLFCESNGFEPEEQMCHKKVRNIWKGRVTHINGLGYSESTLRKINTEGEILILYDSHTSHSLTDTVI